MSVWLGAIYRRLVDGRVWDPVLDQRVIDAESLGVRRVRQLAADCGIAVVVGWGGMPSVSDADATKLYQSAVAIMEAEQAAIMRSERLAALQAPGRPDTLIGTPGELAESVGRDAFARIAPALAAEHKARLQMAGVNVEGPQPQGAEQGRRDRSFVREAEEDGYTWA